LRIEWAKEVCGQFSCIRCQKNFYLCQIKEQIVFVVFRNKISDPFLKKKMFVVLHCEKCNLLKKILWTKNLKLDRLLWKHLFTWKKFSKLSSLHLFVRVIQPLISCDTHYDKMKNFPLFVCKHHALIVIL